MADVLLGKPAQRFNGGNYIVSSSLQIEGQNFEINHKVSQGPVSSTADSFLAAALLPAMKAGGDLRVKGSVSPKLLRATDTIQDIVTSWFPGYTSISIESETSTETDLSDKRGVGAFFSGGIDSFYTLLKQRDEITTLIFMHGYDIQLDKHEFRDRAFRSVEDVAAKFGKDLIEVETNLAESLEKISPSFIPAGGDAHGAVLASIALLLTPQFKKIYIPSSYPYSNLNPWGSHPLLDPLWSTDDVEIVHDGCEADRIGKSAVIAQSETAMRNLRVCFFKPEEGLNCCKCEKCLRCMATLRLLGALDRCKTFPDGLDTEALAQVTIPDDGVYRSYQNLLHAVKVNGDDTELAMALHTCINNYKHRMLAEELNEEMVPFLESVTGERILKGRSNTFFKYLWKADPGWMIKEVIKELFKLADRKFIGSLIHNLRNSNERPRN
jgi:hypothetical protein